MYIRMYDKDEIKRNKKQFYIALTFMLFKTNEF